MFCFSVNNKTRVEKKIATFKKKYLKIIFFYNNKKIQNILKPHSMCFLEKNKSGINIF